MSDSIRWMLAYDAATEKLLEEDHTTGVEQNANEVVREAIWKHRALLRDEMERLDASRSQARPSS